MSNAAAAFLPERYGCLFKRLAIFFTIALATAGAWANVPGGVIGTSGTYPAVTVTSNTAAQTITMSNGIVTAVIDTYTGQILTLTYSGYQVTSGGTGGDDDFFWQGQNSVGEQTGEFGVPSIVLNTSTCCDVMIADLFSNHTSSTDSPDDAYHHFTMFQGSPGIYVTEIMARPSTAPGYPDGYPAGGADIPSFTGGLAGELGSTPFNWLAQDSAGQNVLMPMDSNAADWVSGINSSPKEVTLVNSGLLDGRFNCKYNYSGDLGLLSVTGWCVNNETSTPNIGVWVIHPSTEYFSCGPKHPEILSQILNFNVTFKGVHFGFGSDLSMAAGETWTRVCGPMFVYLNKTAATTVVSGSNPALTGTAQVALYADARAQAAAEKGAWPYSWVDDSHWVPASGRGTVTGTIVISDSGNPLASAANMWVGVAQQPASTESPQPSDFQVWGKTPQYWVKTSATNGSFTIPNVIAGTNYTLFAFGPGSVGQLQSQALPGAAPNFIVTYPATQFSVTVTGGGTTNLGNVTFSPTRYGATAWEIGQLDRDSTEFRHGQDYWHGDNGTAANPAVNWNPYQNYSLDFPGGLTYTVGKNIWPRDWDYAQPNVLNPLTGVWQGTTQTIVFYLPSAPPANSTASLYLALSDFDGPSTTVLVNNNNLGYFYPAYPPGATNDCMIRMESHGIWFDHRVNFSTNLLHSGTTPNTIQIDCPASGDGGYFANCLIYDYLRLEVPGYLPPAPASLSVLPGNSKNVLNWAPAPGATTYNILRSTTSGSTGYSLLASNVTGPICGSTPQPAYYADTSATNGTTYYYEVASVNVTGTSGTSSASGSGTPSSSAPGIPAAPTGLAVTAGNEQGVLSWNASTGASYYLVERSGTTGGPYTIVDSSVPSTSCTDTGLTNSNNYYYVVAAVNASGTSAVSSEVSTLPMPPAPTEAPPQVSATNSGGYPYLTWTGVGGATNYVVQRATSSSGPYTVLYQYNVTDYYSDTSASPSTTYYYEVASANIGGMSAFSAPVAIVTPPAAPATLTATPGNTQVQLNWSASTGATSYIVESGTVSGGPYSIIATTAGVSYVNSGLVNGTPYYYVVAAVNTTGTGLDSAQATATPVATVPVAPTNLTATGTTTAIALNWTASAGATGYTVYRGAVTGGPYSAISSGTSTTYTNSGLPASSTYYYVVAATNAGGASANSNEASASTPPGSVATLTAAAGNTQVQLDWTAASGATKYVVARSLNDSTFTSIGTPTGLSYTDSGLTNGTTYYYIVAGVSSTGTGASSPQENATPTSSVPLAPTGLTATGTNNTVILKWTASAGATGYAVYQASTSGGPYTAIATSVSGTTYTNTGLAAYTTYYYVVSATNAGGMSAYSGEASATTQGVPLNMLTWDSLGASPGDPADGSGTWNTTSALWSNGATDSAWVNSGTNEAVFGNANGAAGTVTLANVTAGGLVFNLAGSGTYTLTSGTLTLSGSSPAITANANATIASIVSGTSGLVLAGNRTVTFSGANTYTGTTTIASGATLSVGSAGALQDTMLNFSSGTLNFAAATSTATIAGLEGTNTAQNMALASTSGAVAVTIGGNNSTTTYSGNISGAGSVTKAGTGALTLANANYTGATTVNDGGSLTISGGNFGSSGNTITIGVDTVSGAAVMYLTGGTATAGTVNIGIDGNESVSSLYISGNASAVFATTNLASTVDTGGQVNIDTTGAVSLGAMSVVRDYGAGNGLIIQAGTVTASTLAIVGNSDHTADLAISGGSLTIGNSSSSGAFEIGQGGDGGTLAQTGGALTYSGSDGLLMSTAAGITSTASITSGTATLTGITLNAVDAASTDSTLTLSGGATLYLGSIGLVENLPGTDVNATFGTATVGASTAWTSSGPITLAGNTTFQTADVLSAAHNITLGGNLTGSGGLTETGAGTLILSGDDSYTGSTTVSSGILEVTGTISGTASLSVASGGELYLAGGTLSVSGGITNGGLFKLSGTPSLTQAGTFINNGVLDLIDGPQSLPADFVNNGTVLNASSVQVQQVSKSGANSFTLTINGYAQHTYQLQRTSSLTAPITWTNVGAAQTGNGTPIIFTDTSASGANGFYQILVGP
jgi:autotransporter-associated beta strand protein